jgi:hypothetical protein
VNFATDESSYRMEKLAMDKNRVVTVGILVAVLLAAPLTVSADLLGSTVIGTPLFPDTSTLGGTGNSAVATVGAGIEFPEGLILFSGNIDITDHQIIWTPTVSVMYLTSTFNGFSLQFSGAPTITNVTLDPASLLSATSISFTADTVFLNFSGKVAVSGESAIFDVNPVPEPATMLLFGLGLAGLAGVRRFKK